MTMRAAPATCATYGVTSFPAPGHMKEPFSLEARTSTKYITFMERSLANAFSPGRNTGFAAHNTALDKRILWQAGAFKDSNDAAFSFDDDGMWNVGGRLVGVPLYEDDGEKVVHLGFSYSHQFRGGSDFMLRYRQRPESNLAPYLANTGSTIPTNDINLINPEIAVVWGPAAFQTEYMRSFVNGDDGMRNSTFWGNAASRSGAATTTHSSRRAPWACWRAAGSSELAWPTIIPWKRLKRPWRPLKRSWQGARPLDRG